MEAEEFQRLGSLPGFLCALALQEPAAFPLCTDLCTKNQKLVTAAMWKIQLIWEEDLGTERSLKGTQRARVPRTVCALLSLLLHAMLCCTKINLLAPGERCWHHRALLPTAWHGSRGKSRDRAAGRRCAANERVLSSMKGIT